MTNNRPAVSSLSAAALAPLLFNSSASWSGEASENRGGKINFRFIAPYSPSCSATPIKIQSYLAIYRGAYEGIRGAGGGDARLPAALYEDGVVFIESETVKGHP